MGKEMKRNTQEEITISKKAFMILEILMTFIFSRQILLHLLYNNLEIFTFLDVDSTYAC